jgi:hypothetical protein
MSYLEDPTLASHVEVPWVYFRYHFIWDGFCTDIKSSLYLLLLLTNQVLMNQDTLR